MCVYRSVESGWTQSWITITLGVQIPLSGTQLHTGMRELNTSLWDVGGSIQNIRADFDTWVLLVGC